MTALSHRGGECLDLLGREQGTALQGLVFPVVGVDFQHHFLPCLQPLGSGGQLLNEVRVPGADTGRSGAVAGVLFNFNGRVSDFVQDALNSLPLRLIGGGVPPLPLYFLSGKMKALMAKEDGRQPGGDGVSAVDIRRQPAGISVQQAVNLQVMVGVRLSFLLLRNPGGLVHGPSVLRRGAALLIVEVAVHLLGTAGQLLVDRVIVDHLPPPRVLKFLRRTIAFCVRP